MMPNTSAASPSTDCRRKITGSCNAGQYLTGINADGTVDCADDVAGVGDITAVVAGAGLAGGAATGAATVGLMSCSPNQILKATSTGWACAADADSGDITGVLAGPGLVGGGSSGDVTIGLPTNCATGQMLKWTGAAWACSADVDTDTNSGGTITAVTTGAGTGLMGGATTGSVALSLTNTCASGQVLKWLGSSWVCSSGYRHQQRRHDHRHHRGHRPHRRRRERRRHRQRRSGHRRHRPGGHRRSRHRVHRRALPDALRWNDRRRRHAERHAHHGQQHQHGRQADHEPRLPAGYTSVGGTLCVETTDVCCYTFSTAANRCRAAGSHLCSSVEMRGALLSGVTLTNGLNQDWIADQDADDSALYVNSATDPANPEGARATSTSSWSRCCVEVE